MKTQTRRFTVRRWFGLLVFPTGASANVLPLLIARALRAFVDGYVAILLPAYLIAIGFDTQKIGFLTTATLLGSSLATVALGALGHRFRSSGLLRGAGLLMAATGVGFASFSSVWPLLITAFVGTLNPSSGDVSIFLPLEHARLASAATGQRRTALFARYGLLGTVCSAVGALAVAVPDWLVLHAGTSQLVALRSMFYAYGAVGVVVWWLYQQRSYQPKTAQITSAAPLGPSRRVVVRLAALFSVDAFASGFLVNSLLSLWLFERFGLSLRQTSVVFFLTGLLSAASQFAAPMLAQRFGLLNTMVFTHIPANICLVLAAFAPSLPIVLALLFVRSALSQMDVPTRNAYVMAVVTPPERPAAASFTAVPQGLAAVIGPTLSAYFISAGLFSLPLVVCGVLKIGYDVLLWHACLHDTLMDEE